MECCPQTEDESGDIIGGVLIFGFILIAVIYVGWKLFNQHVLKPRRYSKYNPNN
jgi:predicted negative regulator of RcsB-dependent stress response